MKFRSSPRFIHGLSISLFLIVSSCLSSSLIAKELGETQPGPFNSDPLTERGISPRVLDIALFPMSQGIAFEMLVRYRSEGERGPRHERFNMVFDPDTDYGRDLFIQFEDDPLRSVKAYKRFWK